MAKTKQPAPRKPVKARGSLPSPRVAPERDTTPWYKKTKFRILIGLLALIVLAVVINIVLDARERGADRRRDARAIGQFERRVQDLNLNIEPVYEGLGQSPGAFLAGELPQSEFRAQAEGWVQNFRDLNQGMRNLEVPFHLEGLQEAKASYVQATTIYVDAAKIFLLAADIADLEAREEAAVLARNTFLHGVAVYGMGDRSLTRIKNEYDLNDPEAQLPAPSLPEEEVQVQPPPPAQDPAAVQPPEAEEPATVEPQGPQEPAPAP
ncbi:MAG TPA: hypothetical protein VM754_09655 [Actinomycetota bacterium]|jgi:hypothetical protein|nr:hypothetical protein [Actinomycetota bacterium]